MKKTATILAFILSAAVVRAQVSFKTIVPKEPVVVGESFQVQYIIEDGDKSENARPPVFSNFRFVAGPNIYMGSVAGMNGIIPVRNAVYTLEAIRPGRFLIQGATITVNGKLVRSNAVQVQVISKEEVIKRFNKQNGNSNSDYFLRPGENANEKIRQNLFVKVMVDKKSCFVGEPVLATFKLYSKLESRSDIVKNPGFYGFTVYDMVSLSDKQVTVENVNGKTFDVHTIRKVQLYPLQAGIFTIDPMQVMNKVEFSRSKVYKKTEQEIVEGVLENDDDETVREGTELFEMDLSTEPITIHVNPVPEKNKPASFSGATGRFTITAALVSGNLAKNEEGFLEIIIAGKGNFVQLDAPIVQWPQGIEGFEPVVKDVLDKTKLPLAGSRTFRYPFVCSSPGTWQLPQVSFSFFDTDSNIYKTITTKGVDVLVSNEDKKKPVTEEPTTSIAANSEKAARIAGAAVVLIVLVILFYWISRKKEPVKSLPVMPQPVSPSIQDLLEPAYAAVADEDNRFYSILHGITWKFVAKHYGLSGSELSKKVLADKLNSANIPRHITEGLFQLLEQCEAGMFTNASLPGDKQDILSAAKEILEHIELSGWEG